MENGDFRNLKLIEKWSYFTSVKLAWLQGKEMVAVLIEKVMPASPLCLFSVGLAVSFPLRYSNDKSWRGGLVKQTVERMYEVDNRIDTKT